MPSLVRARLNTLRGVGNWLAKQFYIFLHIALDTPLATWYISIRVQDDRQQTRRQTMYRIEYRAPDGTWQQHSTGWTQDEAMQVIWKSGLTNQIVFRVVRERRGEK